MTIELRPIFIGGCDRSGTTMLGDMLGATTHSFATPESQFLHELLPLLHMGAFATPLEAARWLQGHFRFGTWELAGSPEKLSELIVLSDPRETMSRILREYLRQNFPEKIDCGVWVDHTPDNFKHYALLHHYFPEARFVHIVRDGRDVFCSIRNLNWGPNNPYMGTRFWAERLQQALAVEIAEGTNCLRIRYEDILQNPEAELAGICEFCELQYTEQMVNGGGLILPGFTVNQHRLVGKRPDPSRIGQWRTQMKAGEVLEFESYAWSRNLMRHFGYALVSDRPARIGGLTVLLRYLHDFLAYGINRSRHRKLERNLLHGMHTDADSRNESSHAATPVDAGQ